MPEIPQAYFREWVPDAPEVSGPDLDDQGLMECPACEGDGIEPVPGVHPKQTRPCSRCIGDGVVEKDG